MSECGSFDHFPYYFVQGILPETGEYVILQQPENLEEAELSQKLLSLKNLFY